MLCYRNACCVAMFAWKANGVFDQVDDLEESFKGAPDFARVIVGLDSAVEFLVTRTRLLQQVDVFFSLRVIIW